MAEEYCLYSACKNKFDGTSWAEWEKEAKFRKPEILDKLKEELSEI